jgi:putative ABC transport system permease protein
MLAISIGLVLAMLVARSSINQKIDSVKAQTGTIVTINPAGVMGGFGGGNALTSAQVSQIRNTAHISNITASLTDQLGTTDTNLTSSLTLGSFGRRQLRFDSQAGDSGTARPAPTPRISVTGTSNPSAVASSATLTSGSMIDGASSQNIALVGSDLAAKNNLTVGKTFTAYGQTFTVQGIYKTGTTFQNSGIIMPLATVQNLTSQAGAVSDVNATVDSADNVTAVVSSLTKTLGSAADITSQQQQAATSVASLQGIAQVALYGVIGAAAAGAVIVLLSMIVIVRERRREIGIIKAIGGTNRTVITQFMTEALTLTVVGGIVGLVFGVLVSGPMTSSLVSNNQTQQSAVAQPGVRGGAGGFGGFRQLSRLGMAASTNIRTVTTTLTPSAFLISIMSILAIAIIGSAVPAWLIARVRPAEVLRSE